uniref:Uncharacterized protein n=1 Tax=Arundo donax TaxID=35708 RepID=A0A0A9DCQ5_ARUDO
MATCRGSTTSGCRAGPRHRRPTTWSRTGCTCTASRRSSSSAGWRASSRSSSTPASSSGSTPATSPRSSRPRSLPMVVRARAPTGAASSRSCPSPTAGRRSSGRAPKTRRHWQQEAAAADPVGLAASRQALARAPAPASLRGSNSGPSRQARFQVLVFSDTPASAAHTHFTGTRRP